MEVQAHGSLVEILGSGVLILGPSGVGKSECALELVRRRHKLVADDVVRLRRDEDQLVGSAPELIRHHMEIRGIGLLYIPELYGENSVRNEATVQLVCRLEHWREGLDYERIGLERQSEKLAGVEVPSLTLPVRAGSSMATLIEVAARDAQKRREGVNAALRLDEKLRRRGQKR